VALWEHAYGEGGVPISGRGTPGRCAAPPEERRRRGGGMKATFAWDSRPPPPSFSGCAAHCPQTSFLCHLLQSDRKGNRPGSLWDGKGGSNTCSFLEKNPPGWERYATCFLCR